MRAKRVRAVIQGMVYCNRVYRLDIKYLILFSLKHDMMWNVTAHQLILGYGTKA